MERRHFLALIAVAPMAMQSALRSSRKRNTDKQATTRYIFSQAMRQASAGQWNRKPIGELMGQFAMLFQGTPYVGGTLEGDGPEVCRIDLTGLDCVTFFENVLDMSRIVKKGRYTFSDLQHEVTFTRYRGGQLGDYTSRLHYTAEWIEDNVAKHVVKDVARELGGVIFPLDVNFMSKNPKYYAPLRNDSILVDKMAAIESAINGQTRYYVPKDRIEVIEPQLQTGDIVAITTNKEGLDYAHTGMIYRTADGVAHLLHASSQKKQVVLDVSVSEYVNGVKSHTGISVLRPIEPLLNER